ncbi:MAG: DUF975 family protein [Clostridiales bacterium]|nr:DUF975 family protein [Clostridiales bacterium]
MTTKDIKEEARKKLALNMHQAIALYTIELTILITLIALVVMSCVCLGVNKPAAIVMICYGCLLGIMAFVGMGMVNFGLVDFYLWSYRCKPYNIRRLGETLARSNITKIFILSLKRTLLAFLLLLCLIVPGVIYLIRTSMANYLLIANPKMKPSAALSASNKVMSGKTGPYFALCMSLIGWYLLGVVTLGLGFIFILPYTNLVKVVYYKRNLQGDKAIYTYTGEDSPSVYANPPAYGVAQTSAAQAQQAQQDQVQVVQAQAQQEVLYANPAPMDALEEEDIRDMNDAMRVFGNEVEDNVPEVPLTAPVKKTKANKTEPAPEVQAEPVVVEAQVETPVVEPIAVGKPIDDSGIVETERVLTTQEIEANDAARNRIIADMYAPGAKRKPEVNYFGGDHVDSAANGTAQSDTFVDDFGVEPSEPQQQQQTIIEPQPIVQSQPVIVEEPTAIEEPVISDVDFDAFLREFDSQTEAEQAEAAATEPEPVAPTAANDRRAARPVAEPRRNADRASVRGSANNSNQPSDRAERMRREREERLNNLNKKQ